MPRPPYYFGNDKDTWGAVGSWIIFVIVVLVIFKLFGAW